MVMRGIMMVNCCGDSGNMICVVTEYMFIVQYENQAHCNNLHIIMFIHAAIRLKLPEA